MEVAPEPCGRLPLAAVAQEARRCEHLAREVRLAAERESPDATEAAVRALRSAAIDVAVSMVEVRMAERASLTPVAPAP